MNWAQRALRALAALSIVPLAFARSPSASSARGLDTIKHVIVIMQENRSFDHYFGTYPGADGIPRRNGVPAACIPDPQRKRCGKPYHDRGDINDGGAHRAIDAVTDMDGGKMDGFIRSAESIRPCAGPRDVACRSGPIDVMGYHDRRELPTYWTWADHFVLQDHMFEPNLGWSLPAHLFMVSGWSASCTSPTNPMSCRTDLYDYPINGTHANWSWTDITYLMHKAHVPWAYYINQGLEPDCADGEPFCQPRWQRPGTPGIWNPLPYFTTVRNDGETDHIQDISRFFAAARTGQLPAVSWIVPNGPMSEHPLSRLSIGQEYVSNIVHAIASSHDWYSSAIFLAWDDWGGFYDHLRPPRIDANGYGLRVPALVIGPYARHGVIDHQILSFDAYLKFIEDVFLAHARIDPLSDGRRDPRPTARERVEVLGDLARDFDFTQAPAPPSSVDAPVPPPPPVAHDRGPWPLVVTGAGVLGVGLLLTLPRWLWLRR